MGLQPVLGRLLGSNDDGPKAAGAAVLTHRFWTTTLQSDPSVIGKAVRLGDRAATIVGVLEPSVPYPSETEIIANVVTSPHHLSATMVDGRVHRMTELFGRLAPGADLAAARAELRAVHGAILKEHPEAYPASADFRIDAVGLRDQIVSPARTVLLVLLAASALVFIIACSNVANLILARSVRREGELAIRAALGASAGALRRTLLAESLLLCGAGAILGVAIARPMVAILARYAARFSVRALDLTVDSSLLWVGVEPGARRGSRPGFRSAPAVCRRSERARPVDGKRADHVWHEPPSAAVCRDANRRVVRAPRRRRDAADGARGAADGADRLQHAQRARDERAPHLLLAPAGTDGRLLQGGVAAHRRAAGDRAGRHRHDRAVARRRDLRLRLPVLGGGVRESERRRGPARAVPHHLAGILRSARREDHCRPRLHRGRPPRRRAGRHREPEPGAAHVRDEGRAEPSPALDRSGHEVHRREHRPPPDRRHRRRRGRRERRAGAGA